MLEGPFVHVFMFAALQSLKQPGNPLTEVLSTTITHLVSPPYTVRQRSAQRVEILAAHPCWPPFIDCGPKNIVFVIPIRVLFELPKNMPMEDIRLNCDAMPGLVGKQTWQNPQKPRQPALLVRSMWNPFFHFFSMGCHW